MPRRAASGVSVGPMRRQVLGGLLLLGLLAPPAWATEPVAILTRLRASHGEIQVKPRGEERWAEATLLMELRPDDLVRATGQAEAVVLYLRGGRVETVTAASEVRVEAPARAGPSRLTVLVSAVAEELLKLKRAKPPTYMALGGRGPDARLAQPVIVGPRATRVLPGPLSFEWTGPRVPYRVRVLAPDGRTVWSSANVTGFRLPYPDQAPRLAPGTTYTWVLDSSGRYADERASFEVLSESEGARVRAALVELEPSALPAHSASATALLKSGFLFTEGLHDAARLELESSIAGSAGDRTLHYLLGHVYDRIGLDDRAIDAFREAAASARP